MSFHLSKPRSLAIPLGLTAAFLFSTPAGAGVVNPDISALGQVKAGITNDPTSIDKNQPTLKSGEVEVVLDAALNPYLKGWFTLSGDENGVGVEEAYTSVVNGLPWGLGMKAGKYRLGFGKLNQTHPHAYPFIDAPRSLASLLPGGADGFNETGVQVSELLPMPGDLASTLSADVLQGHSFHPGDDRTRLGWLGRWSNSFLLGDQGAMDVGISGATGTDNVDRDTRALLVGVDAKAKFYLPGSSQLTVQGEGIFRQSHLNDTVFGNFSRETRSGALAFFDYRYHTQLNGGLLYEQWERAGASTLTDHAVKAFAGYAVLEESTLIRIADEYLMPEGGSAVNTVSAQLLFAMGPHKAHQF